MKNYKGILTPQQLEMSHFHNKRVCQSRGLPNEQETRHQFCEAIMTPQSFRGAWRGSKKKAKFHELLIKGQLAKYLGFSDIQDIPRRVFPEVLITLLRVSRLSWWAKEVKPREQCTSPGKDPRSMYREPWSDVPSRGTLHFGVSPTGSVTTKRQKYSLKTLCRTSFPFST